VSPARPNAWVDGGSGSVPPFHLPVSGRRWRGGQGIWPAASSKYDLQVLHESFKLTFSPSSPLSTNGS